MTRVGETLRRPVSLYSRDFKGVDWGSIRKIVIRKNQNNSHDA